MSSTTPTTGDSLLPDDQQLASSLEAQDTAQIDPDDRRFTVSERIQIWLISAIASLAIRLIGPTLRYTLSYEEGAPEPWHRDVTIWVFWHRCVFPAAWQFRNHQIAVITSQSYDGEYIARTIENFGFRAVRGSSSRGGARALRGLNRELEEGRKVAFTIDGPRGPRYVAKFGPIALSRKAQRPIQAFYAALERPWTLNSWDRFMIPKPFSRAFIRCSAPILVPADAEPDTLKRYHAQMQAALDRVTAFAEAALASKTN